jgi:predicted lipid-binding transport protein (Tim44 family)
MADSQVLDVILLVVAGIVLFRLYTVLGRRTGNERPREDFRLSGPQPAPGAPDNVVKLPDRAAAKPEPAREGTSDPVAGALLDIKLADRNFETEHFVSGAKAAYEMILTAFAKADKATLKPLLSDEVFTAFDSTIAGRDQRGERVTFTFVGYKDAKIAHAALKGRTAEITVAFGAQFISSTTDAQGTVIEGDPKNVRDVTDVWTFARDVRARDPNWTLVATSGAPT